MPESRKTLLTAVVPPLDKYWAIETAYGRKAQRELDRHDFAAHTDKFRAGYYDEDEDSGGDAPSKPYAVNGDGVAVLYLSGPMTKRPTSMSYLFGGTSTVLTRRAVRQAAADPDVLAIALIIDSPGGQVNGTADLAADVAAACEKKPVGAYAEDTCCSAAYWVGSQADFLYCNLTAAVGSIGTLLVIEDTSGAYAQEGVKVHVVSTGDYKGAGADGAAVTEAHLEDFQREVDEINACFLDGVTQGRDNLALDDVRALATGQVHIGQKAVDLGLCDAVTSLDEFMASMAMEAEGVDAPAALPDLPPDQGDADPTGPDASAPPPASPVPSEPASSEPVSSEPVSSEPVSSPILGEVSDSPLPAANQPPVSPAASFKETDNMPDEIPVLPTAPAATAASARTAINGDILTACQAAGITNAKELADRLSMARLGDRYAEEVRADAKVQAVRAYGAETGQLLQAQCDALPVEIVAGMRDGWQAEADKKFGIGEDGKAPARKTAPAAQKNAVPAEAGADAAATKWDRLTAAQRGQGEAMGMKTPEQRESFAATVLGTTAGETN